jgi:integrase
MATFRLHLDKRVPLKDDKYNLAVRMVNGNDVMYLKITPITETLYNLTFNRKSMDPNVVSFRNECQKFLEKCEQKFLSLKPFDKKRFRELVYRDDVTQEPVSPENSFLLKTLITDFVKRNETVKLKTKDMYMSTINFMEDYKKGITLLDITPGLLIKIEKFKLEKDIRPSTISAYFRHLRAIINYYMYEMKTTPPSYKYPFGKGGYSIKRYQNLKQVMSEKEIQSIIDFKEFENKDQEYARDIWVMLYRCNGINFADLFRMKWTNIRGQFMIFTRMKTENTRKNNVREIVVPLNDKILGLIEKIGDKKSPYILGLLSQGDSDEDFKNKKDWQQQKQNRNLKFLTEKLNLSVPLKLKTARDSYATTLKRKNTPTSTIGEMLGHSNSIVTEHYLASMDLDKLWEINEQIL